MRNIPGDISRAEKAIFLCMTTRGYIEARKYIFICDKYFVSDQT